MLRNKVLGAGAVADMIRQKDWAQTPLGPIDEWSPALLTSINMILEVPTPIQILWGESMSVLYNDPFVPILANRHPYALGRSAREVWADVWPSVGAELEAVFAEGRSFSFSDLPLELIHEGKRDAGFFTFTYSPIRDAAGQVVGLLNISQNTTATVNARRSLQRSEYRFRSLVTNASVGIAIGSLSGELTYLNPTLLGMLGYTPEEVAETGLQWTQLTPPQYAEVDARAIEQLTARGIAEPYEKAYCDKGGVPIPLLIGASVIPSDEELAGSSDIAVFATDLRAQKRAEAALLQTEKLAAVGKLASSISHEINNPLEAVTNLLFIARQSDEIPQHIRDYLELADRELARVSQVTAQTLRFHRQSTAATAIRPEALVEEALQLYAPRLENSAVKVRREYAPNLFVTCFEGDIRQVLNNLIGNALDAMKTGGRLNVRTRQCIRWSTGETGIRITIADSGSGMSAAVRQRIFEAFYTTKGIHGTGLGLWISCRIVHKHKGYIRSYSSRESSHHGSVFALWLPLNLAETAREPWHHLPSDLL